MAFMAGTSACAPAAPSVPAVRDLPSPRFALEIAAPSASAGPTPTAETASPPDGGLGPSDGLGSAASSDLPAPGRPDATPGHPAASPAGQAPPGRSTGSGSGGGSGGGGAAGNATASPTPRPDPIDLAGHVRTAMPEGEGGPVAGAVVKAYVGGAPIEAVTAADGAFVLPGFVPGSPVLVTAPGHVPSVVSGWAGEPETLHLAAGSPLAGRWEQHLAVSGVVTLEGAPVTGAVVIGGNARGTAFGPLVTGPDGRFSGLATSFEGTTAAGLSVFAFQADRAGQATTLGMANGQALGAGAAPIAIPLRLPVDVVRLVVASAPEGERRTAGISARTANGMAVSLASWATDEPLGDAPLFAVPGVEQVAQIEYASGDGQATSVWRRGLPVDPGEAKTVRAGLLPIVGAPAVGAGAVAEGRTLAWPPTPGADLYRVSLYRGDAGEPVWEALTPWPEVMFVGLPDEPPDRLAITAQGGASAGMRQLASLDRPRRLRWHDQQALERFTTRAVPLPR